MDVGFSEDGYRTAEGRRRGLLVRLLGWSRVPLCCHVITALSWARYTVWRGRFSAEEFVRQAMGLLARLEACGGRFEISGLEHVRALPGPAVIVGNHMSALETMLLPAMVLPHRPLSFVVKRSLVSAPLFGPILNTLDPVCVDRENPREDLKAVLTGGAERLEAGRCVCVFPQSTRSTVFDVSQFNSIGTKLAQRTGVPVLPLALRTDFWGNGRGVLRDFGPLGPCRDIHFAFGEPIPPGTSARDAQRQVVAFIREHLLEWGVHCLDG
jgi:1-acyl-sn-glycerol-3-phosphate acyltransferase